MNTRTFISSIVLTLGAASGIASAAPALNDASSLSRVEVRAELTRANAAGEINTRGEAWGSVVAVSTRSRAEVLAELNVARANGLLDQRGETYGALNQSDFNSTRTRAAVLAEAQGGGFSRGERTFYLGGE